jgi:protein gp37
MANRTSIEWTDFTWNPVTGCTKVSAGCDNCYAAALAQRLLSESYKRRLPVIDTQQNRDDPFAVRLWPERLEHPGRLKEPRVIFVNSMSDLFHPDVPESFVRKVFVVMLEEKRHTFQVLTKRPARASRFFHRNADLFQTGRIPEHIWMGTSVENQKVAYRVRHLAAIPAGIRFLSCEPLLGSLVLDLANIDWVIVGGESGPKHRPLEMEWAREVRDQCTSAKVPFFFKQVGGRTPKAAGRLLDGRTWDERPHLSATP